MNKAYGYPYERLVSGKKSNSREHLFYRGLFFWLNVSFLILYLGVFAKFWRSQLRLDQLFILSKYFAFAWPLMVLLFHTIKMVKSSAWAKKKVSFYLPHWVKRWFRMDNSLVRRWIKPLWGWITYQLLRCVWAGPHDFFGNIVSGYLKTDVSFGIPFRIAFRRKFQKQFGMDPRKVGTNAFWLPYAYITSRSPEHSAILSNWLQLYGFARNLSTAFYLSFVYAVASMLLHVKVFGVELLASDTARIGSFLPGIYMLLAFVMWFRYFYLYSGYFSKFAFRSFIVLSEPAKVPDRDRGGLGGE